MNRKGLDVYDKIRRFFIQFQLPLSLVGRHCFHHCINDYGERLVDLCRDYRMKGQEMTSLAEPCRTMQNLRVELPGLGRSLDPICLGSW